MARKFGRDGRLNAVHDQLVQLGAEVGLPFAFDKIARAPNTLDAHRLIRWAAATGAQGAAVDRLFRAYFVEGRDIGDRATLLDIAAEHGLDRERVARLLEEGADVEAVRNEISEAQAIGVTGVPFFIFAGRLGVPGAQDVSVLRRAIDQARPRQRAEPAAEHVGRVKRQNKLGGNFHRRGEIVRAGGERRAQGRDVRLVSPRVVVRRGKSRRGGSARGWSAAPVFACAASAASRRSRARNGASAGSCSFSQARMTAAISSASRSSPFPAFSVAIADRAARKTGKACCGRPAFPAAAAKPAPRGSATRPAERAGKRPASSASAATNSGAPAAEQRPQDERHGQRAAPPQRPDEAGKLIVRTGGGDRREGRIALSPPGGEPWRVLEARPPPRSRSRP